MSRCAVRRALLQGRQSGDAGNGDDPTVGSGHHCACTAWLRVDNGEAGDIPSLRCAIIVRRGLDDEALNRRSGSRRALLPSGDAITGEGGRGRRRAVPALRESAQRRHRARLRPVAARTHDQGVQDAVSGCTRRARSVELRDTGSLSLHGRQGSRSLPLDCSKR